MLAVRCVILQYFSPFLIPGNPALVMATWNQMGFLLFLLFQKFIPSLAEVSANVSSD